LALIFGRNVTIKIYVFLALKILQQNIFGLKLKFRWTIAILAKNETFDEPQFWLPVILKGRV